MDRCRCDAVAGDGGAWERGINFYDTADAYGRGKSEVLVGAGLDASLTRLETDHVDVYQLHGPDVETMTDELFDLMNGLKAEDKIRAWGVSIGSIEEAMKTGNACVSVSQMFKLLGNQPADRSIAAGILTRTLWHSLYNLEEGTVTFDFYLGETNNGNGSQELRSGYVEFSLAPARENAF